MAGDTVRGFRIKSGGWSLRNCLFAGALLLAAVASPLKLGVITGMSMSPSMTNGTFYLMDRTYFRNKPLERDEVVVFDHNGDPYIKRVVGVPGDSIYVVRYKGGSADEVVMDWQLSRLRRAISRPPWKAGMKLVELQLGPGEYYVVGDNLAESVDSRTFGPISAEDIRGRVLWAPPGAPETERLARHYGRPAKS